MEICTIVLLNPDLSFLIYTANPDQLALVKPTDQNPHCLQLIEITKYMLTTGMLQVNRVGRV